MKVRIRPLVRFALLALVACGPGPVSAPGDAVRPGESISLAALVSRAAGGQAVTWSVDPGGGTITQAGVYTAPTCAQILAALAAPDLSRVGQISGTDTVHAVWNGGGVDIAVHMAEAVLGIEVTPSDATVPIGGTVQFTVVVQYTCHVGI